MTIVILLTLGTAENLKNADKHKKDCTILKVIAHLQDLDAEYRKIDLSDPSEAAVYFRRLLNPATMLVVEQKDLDSVVFHSDEANLLALQQIATELHTAHGSSGYKSLPEDMKPVLLVYLKFLDQWEDQRREFLKRLWEQ